ncbi:MalY/PatB family protein [Schaalia sp. lx-260]|uniref:MalY/PatB family protein n=1 Tax=Schaalia sp. lx-260 TaxID=2899082 RepID=UPI001E4B2CBD|nr:aminotransferase class I/II-fold pyridoxal phosphate-dependent enzyme [Schaalia sp. lx-260]MCD4550064.1 aminotransferase class I/II-fold pyridoxal phosphate-dependent enzyme [Schaalia sp. lx-260]
MEKTIEQGFNDEHLDRWGSHSAKWDLLAAPLGNKAVSLSVADMEFRTAPCVAKAVHHAAQLDNYGYTEVFDDYRHAAARWQRIRYGWDVESADVHFFARIVQCVSALVNFILPARLERCPVVVTLTPAYGPICEVVKLSGSHIREVPFVCKNGVTTFDHEAFARAMDGADLLLWCNPHNPTGRVWTHNELSVVAEYARRHHVLVLSDDVHADFVRPQKNTYIPFAYAAPDLWRQGSIIQCASPGKTFTIAGLESAAIMVRGNLGQDLESAKRQMGLHNPNYFAIPATIAAWTQGESWVNSLQSYIDENIHEAVHLLRKHLPNAQVNDPEGTYLIWVEASAYISDEKALLHACQRSGVAITPGSDFGAAYERYFRVNVALPRNELREALTRLCAALNDRTT